MNSINTYKKDYSIAIYILSFLFSLISIIFLFSKGSLLWVLTGISLFISLRCFLIGAYKVYRFLYLSLNSSIISKSILYFNAIIFFFSSSYGLIKCFGMFDLISNTELYTPITIILFLILSCSIGLHRPIMVNNNR